jgi:hypothetical protein
MISFPVFHPSYNWTQFDGMKLDNLMVDECNENCPTFDIFFIHASFTFYHIKNDLNLFDGNIAHCL